MVARFLDSSMLASSNSNPARSASNKSVSYQKFLLIPVGRAIGSRSKLDWKIRFVGLGGKDFVSSEADNSIPHSWLFWRDIVRDSPGVASHLTAADIEEISEKVQEKIVKDWQESEAADMAADLEAESRYEDEKMNLDK